MVDKIHGVLIVACEIAVKAYLCYEGYSVFAALFH